MTRVLTCDHNSLHFFICIYTWFCDFIEPKYRSQSCDNTRAIIYIFRPKEKVLITGECWTFTINYFPWAWMIPLSLTVIAYMSISWWLYNMLENYKLHHPCNDNTRTMQKQCFFWRINFKFALFLCVHVLCVLSCTHILHMLPNCSRQMQVAHSSFKNEIINLTDVGENGSATESHNS